MQKGFGMAEAVVAISIVASFILILASINAVYLKISYSQNSSIQGAFLAEEGIEAARYLRDASWTQEVEQYTPGVEYFLSFSNPDWQLTTTPTMIGIFDRRIRFDSVYRDADDNIVSSGGTLDPNTRMITSVVSWAEHGSTSTKAVSTYITNLFAN